MHLHADVPLDILGHIADILGSEDGRLDRETLKVLSQTCKFMVPVCRRHLFSSLRLPFYLTSVRRSLGLRNLLLSNPAMTSYFKILSFDVAQPFCGSDYDILHMICASSSPTTVSIFGGNWNYLTERAKSLILALAQNSTVHRLALKSIDNFPAAALSLCSSLNELKLCGINDFASPDDNFIMKNSNKIPLISLHVYSVSNATLATLMAPAKDLNTVGVVGLPLRFDRLKQASFQISIPSETLQMYELLEKAVSLELFAIEVRPQGHLLRLTGLGSRLAVNTHPTLRLAKFSLCVYSDYNNPIRELTHELEHISGNNILEELEVTVTTTLFMLQRTKLVGWVDLDTVLTSPGAFPMLRRVAFQLKCQHIYDWIRNSPEFLPSNLTEKRFPRLLADTSIDFVYREAIVYDNGLRPPYHMYDDEQE
ncbi:hypothetical protein HYPSUDRAFT_87925 [Hypholoma sublateritium FD-334 SS-4]|uniref:F-box domain-containing protein n=1 Tax=Hypholoma sublateritium (strain FD-334 SS-4) TaxID=945553 RepID=A0A0D2NSB9_HYPSF|nr:hypothetical protein HYPSUDRAFT_87925 [Hypholoma sublateritium FD-334 SS-4]